MHRLLYLITLSIFAFISGSSCSGNVSVDEAADKIDRALDAGNVEQAQAECERFFRNRADLEQMSVPELCRLSIILADLAEEFDDRRDENAAQAVLCYRTAIEKDSIQTMKYLRSLDTDDYRHVYLLNRLLQPITDREDGVIYVSEEDEWVDSAKCE